jgi:cytochrome c-type biogenesis protein
VPESNKLKTTLAVIAIGIFAVIVVGVFWFFLWGPESPVGFGWYLFSFAAGLTMIVLPCTLPLAFVIVPLSMGKGIGKGLGIALSFSIGVILMLSIYGVLAALAGSVAIDTFGAPLETVKNWLYFIAGIFAYIFALGEIGLAKFRMPTYTGAAPAFIQRQSDYLKPFFLGLFLGNIGVGCPHPATPYILTRIATSHDVYYGWLLFFIHGVGRILPLLLLAILGVLGVNALSWLIARKEKVERATGWGMVFVAGFILVLGLFTHDWWVASGQHTLFEELTQEHTVTGYFAAKIGRGVAHTHGFEEVLGQTGLLGMPLQWGNWVLVALWLLPMWWYYIRKQKEHSLKMPKI